MTGSSESNPVRPGERMELTIDSLAFGGAGVARHAGLVILVEGGVPGDRVAARLTHRARNFARAQTEAILVPSPARQQAECAHFAECGGCAYQTLDYAFQLAAKRRQVVDLLERVGGFSSPPVASTIPSPSPFRYRNRMSYAVPSRKGEGPGLHRRGNVLGILEVPHCLLPRQDLQDAYLQLLSDLRNLAPQDRPERIEIAVGEIPGRPIAALLGKAAPDHEIRRLARKWTQGEPLLGGVVWIIAGARPGRHAPESVDLLAGEGHILQRMGSFGLRVPAGSFSQANPVLAWEIFKEIAGRCAGADGEVLELYSGTGALSLALAGSGRSILAVEGDGRAARAARENCRANGIESIQVRHEEVGRALRGLQRAGRRFGTVVLDPPRTGLPGGTSKLVSELAEARILYLSCNPATLARDLRQMVGERGWGLATIIPFDLFPQTAELECLAELLPYAETLAPR